MTTSNNSLSTAEVLADRKLGRSIDQRHVDWAIDMLCKGEDSPRLRVLAGELPPFDSFELREMLDRVFVELGLSVHDTHEDAAGAIARIRARQVLAGEVDRGEALAELADLYIDLDYASSLMGFYLLSNALDDLRHEEVQWYWDGADRQNIEQLVDEQLRRFLDGHPVSPPESRSESQLLRVQLRRASRRGARIVNPVGELILFSFAGAFLTAVVFVVALTWSLPPTDGAYGQTPFGDPLVLPVMAVGATIAALLVLPFTIVLLRRALLPRSATVVIPMSLVAIAVTTPFFMGLAVVTAFLATIGAMIYCRRRWPLPGSDAPDGE